jgi:hypothetical protein
VLLDRIAVRDLPPKGRLARYLALGNVGVNAYLAHFLSLNTWRVNVLRLAEDFA